MNHEARNVQVVTFGQPRIGNAVFASYYSQLVPNTIRVVHEHDMVPHLPPYYSYFPHKTYHHFPREVNFCFNCLVKNKQLFDTVLLLLDGILAGHQLDGIILNRQVYIISIHLDSCTSLGNCLGYQVMIGYLTIVIFSF